ncbi:aminotransferase-like domain-containing protein [Paenimyroides baculatum]|uniref:PLP-dependent aminotransferase family protein n=1 Tax=Paenimyroides baculatum TaxID=2608000 RepID=A0A5M6CVM9_9FLAO|nr:PLP-dependent aminotransferase family protein [Paenimyroides baculatum]KAA5538042.1 PLP-dependent aminotransferase family protein [Paenimyroides baculatum]
MNSPAEDILQNIITIDKNNTAAVYVQIAQHIINAVQRGYFSVGTLLPGTRSLSNLLKIHRNTAVAVYDELASQGWVEIVPNKGTFVLNPIRQKPIVGNFNELKNEEYPTKTGFHFYESAHLASPYEKVETIYTFNDGQTDIRLHTDKQYNRWYNAVLKRTSVIKKWNTFLFDQSSFLSTQLCNYLNATRNLHIAPKNLLTTRSTEMNLYLVAQLLLKPNDVVLVGNVSNFAANMIFHQAKANIKTIPIDENGLDVSFIKKNFTKNSIRCVYCTPQRHYPTTNSLSAQRRLQLMQLAKEYGFAIIEDDFDFDFQFDATPMPPMASADTNGLIIYLGKVGQALFPAFETGFIVAPENLITEVKNYYRMIDPQGDLIKEQILAEVIHEGEMHRQVKKKILLYKARRDTMCEALKNTFGDLITFNKPNGGLALFIQFNKPISLVKLSDQVSKYNVTLPKHLLYQTKNMCGIRLGFGHLNLEEINHTIQMLKKAYDDLTVK